MDEVRSVITERLNDNISRVDIIEDNTDFLFKIFPSILYWRIHGIPICCHYPSVGADARGEVYRRSLLPLMGVKVLEVDHAPAFRGYFFNGHDDLNASAMIGPIAKVVDEQDAATYFSGLSSLAVVRSLFESVQFSEQSESFVPSIVSADQRELIQRLLSVRQYAGCELTLQTVKISELSSITRYVHEFKYRQIPKLIELYRKFNIEPFDAAKVQLLGGKSSLITPPVVEICGDKLVLIEGTTRATWMLKNGFTEMRVVLVKGVTEPLLGDIIPLRHVRVIHNSKRDVRRYGERFNYAYFRKIEESVHLISDI